MSHRKTSTRASQTFEDNWFVAARCDEIEKQPLQRFYLGKPYVLFRDDQQHIACLEDACLHRGTPLSWGCVVSGEIECPYHKWKFGPNGACTFIPQHGDDLPTRKIPSFSTFERGGLVFVSLDGEDTLPDNHLPEDMSYQFESLPLNLSEVVEHLINSFIQEDVAANNDALTPFLEEKIMSIGEADSRIIISHQGYRIQADGNIYFLTPAEKDKTYVFCPQKSTKARRNWWLPNSSSVDEGCRLALDREVNLSPVIKKALQDYLRS